LDGSPAAEWALPAAISIARRSQATLELVSVEIVLPTVGALAGLSVTEPWSGGSTDARTYQEDVARRIASVYPAPVKQTVITGTGRGANALIRHARDAKADLIVMTTHGYGPLRRFWLGAVADTVVRRTHIPTLLIHPEERAVELNSEPHFHRVLIPLDGSATAASILEHAIAVGEGERSVYTLIQITLPMALQAGEGAVHAAARAGHEQAGKYLALIADGLRQRRVRVETKVLPDWFPATTILDFAETNQMNLIAMTTRGQGGPARWLLGSVADKVVRGAMIPVLVYRSLVR
jgi:nucleotide-binding universal stress UspA family protein